MSFKASILISADGKQAQAALKLITRELNKAGIAAEETGRKGRRGAERMAAAQEQAARAAEAQAAGERAAAQAGRELEAVNRRAAAQVGNLTAQFNDIGMMLMAGQNPLQLAIQQGTQITQVIGPMGAAGAAEALGAAFMSMLSPINLVTIGGIAAGAALMQWLTGATEEAETFADAVEQLGSAVDDYRAIVDEAAGSTGSLAERFGTGTSQAREYLLALAEVKRREALIGAAKTERSLTGGVGSYRQAHQVQSIGEQFGLTVGGIAGQRRQAARELVGDVILAYEQLDATANASVEEQIAAWERTYEAVRAASEAVDGVSEAENERLRLIAEQILRLRELQAADEAAAKSGQNAWAEYVASRQRGAEFLARTRERERAALAAIYGQYVQTRQEADAETRSAEDLLARLERQNALQEAIRRHGEGSAEVARLRADAERAAFEETLASMDVSETLKEELRKAFEHGQALAGLDIAGGVGAASENAKALADWLGVSLETAKRLEAVGPQGTPKPAGGRGGDPRQFGGSFADWQNRDAIIWLDHWKPPRSGRGRGGGAGTDPVKKLLASLQQEIDLLRTLDPLEREMIKHREALKGATEAERKAVHDLIQERLAEQDVLAERELLTGTMYDAFDRMIIQGESFADVMDSVRVAIERAALQALLLGEGPLARLFGMQASGGLLGIFASAILPGAATGGLITGPGSGTSDQVPVMLSSGEFVMTAEATRRHRHLLEAMNAGTPPRALAAGGPVALPPRLAARPTTVVRPAGGREATVINHFHITTPDARSFANNRVAVARGAARILEQARRYS